MNNIVFFVQYSHPYKTRETEINTKFTFMYRYKFVSLHKYKLVLRKPREFTVKPCQLFRDQFLYFIFSIRGEIIISTIWCSILIDYFLGISVRFITNLPSTCGHNDFENVYFPNDYDHTMHYDIMIFEK